MGLKRKKWFLGRDLQKELGWTVSRLLKDIVHMQNGAGETWTWKEKLKGRVGAWPDLRIRKVGTFLSAK